jgi:ribosome maturation factor RimP
MKADNKQIIYSKLEELLADQTHLFIVNVKVDIKNNIKVFLDGDAGISIGECTATNRHLYKFIEEETLFTDNDFSLEVSSPGVDEPLLLNRQYIKNIGRSVEVLLKDGNKIEGKLLEAKENSIAIEVTTGKGKKAIIEQKELPIEDIKSTIVQINFNP